MYFAGVEPIKSQKMTITADHSRQDLFRTFTKLLVILSVSQFSLKIIIHLIFKMRDIWASSVVQWLRIHLAMLGTLLSALVLENPTCCTAMEPPEHHDY